MIRELTCIVCPKGCALRVELEGKAVKNVTGHTCPRGRKYAEDECTQPMRTVTSTVRTVTGEVVAVKTATAIPKEKMIACMQEINRTVVPVPVEIGDVLIKNVADTGVAVVATANLEMESKK